MEVKWSQDEEELESAGKDNKRRDKRRQAEGTGVKDGRMYSKLISPDWNYSHCITLSQHGKSRFRVKEQALHNKEITNQQEIVLGLQLVLGSKF